MSLYRLQAQAQRSKPAGQNAPEYKRLGFLCSADLLWFWKDKIKISRILAKDLGKHVGRTVRLVGFLVTLKEAVTIKGDPMEFVSFEDETDIFETVFFPETYRRFSPR